MRNPACRDCQHAFNKDYYVDSIISNYKDYRKKDFSGLANDLYPLVKGKSVLDYGAATGGLIYALTSLQVYCEGTDISHWAVEYGKHNYNLEHLLHHYDPSLLSKDFNVILFLDVLEHLSLEELNVVLGDIDAKKLIVRIPVAKNEGEDFVLEVSRKDKTHIQVHSKMWWYDLFYIFGFRCFRPLDTPNIYDSPGVLAGIFRG